MSLKVPLLLKGAIARTGDDALPGAYCQQQHVWVADGRPIVRGRTPTEMLTKTEAQVEGDDTRDTATLEMLTKTKAEVESDDDRFDLLAALEMLTKTFAEAERDD